MHRLRMGVVAVVLGVLYSSGFASLAGLGQLVGHSGQLGPRLLLIAALLVLTLLELVATATVVTIARRRADRRRRLA